MSKACPGMWAAGTGESAQQCAWALVTLSAVTAPKKPTSHTHAWFLQLTQWKPFIWSKRKEGIFSLGLVSVRTTLGPGEHPH